MRTKASRAPRGFTATRTVLLIAAVGLIGVLAYRQIGRLAGSSAAVWVTATDLRVGQILTGAHLKLIRTAPPNGALVNRSDIEGRTLILAKATGQPFYVGDLAPKAPAPSLSGTVPVGRLLATIRVDAMDLPVRELRAGDRLDVIQAGPDGVRLVAHDAYVMGVLGSEASKAPKGGGGLIMGADVSTPGSSNAGPSGSSLVLGLLPQDVFPMAAAEASGQRMKIVLHSAGEVQSGTLLNVLPPTRPPPLPARSTRAAPGGASVELMTGGKNETIFFSNEPGEPVSAPRAAKAWN